MDRKVILFLTKLTIFIGVFVATSSTGYCQNTSSARGNKKKEISDRKYAKQRAKVDKKKKKHVYKIQDKATRKRMKKAYKNAMRRSKK